jgi:hypothetical protein
MPIDSYGSSPQNPYLNPTPEVHTPQEPLQDKPLSSTNQEHSTGSNNDPELAAHMADMYGSTSTLPDQQHPTTIYGYPTTGPGSAGGTYDPHAILQRRYEQQELHYPMEQQAPHAAGPYQIHQTDAGPYSTRRGWGGQPFVQTRQANFNNAGMRGDYDSLVATLNSADPIRQENMAEAMLTHMQGQRVNFGQFTDGERHAMTLMMGITQNAEEARTPGSAAFARASLRNIADGVSTFSEEFNRQNGAYVPAHVGGTGQMREYAPGTRIDPRADETAANMSDDEDFS